MADLKAGQGVVSVPEAMEIAKIEPNRAPAGSSRYGRRIAGQIIRIAQRLAKRSPVLANVSPCLPLARKQQA
ncbi:MAG TPA: hypothetical protein VHB99_15990, partial [Pirellulales bacterium]|nr:hypothetical protein [Pirellulales bacterium]